MDNLLIEVARSDLSFLRTGVIVKTSGAFGTNGWAFLGDGLHQFRNKRFYMKR